MAVEWPMPLVRLRGQGTYFFAVLGLILTSVTLVSFALLHPGESGSSNGT